MTMKAHKQYEFWMEGRHIGVSISGFVMKKLLSECKKSNQYETGGVLWGKYNDVRTVAQVTELSGPPQDSCHGGFSFKRGIAGLQKIVDTLWNAPVRRYYLGEWHFHPLASPEPSSVDIAQMQKHAADRRLQCPEPILIVLGGDPRREWTVSVSVFTRSGLRFRLT